ncbi:hypothetical protein [Paenibacillus sp. PAMC21692]|nr:hypothetical protein [Paenibacillus sp. PAMC21692]QNK57180.1 hypothetical protein H7F31_32660 [Paenibacillus sp. PAMC21692]
MARVKLTAGIVEIGWSFPLNASQQPDLASVKLSRHWQVWIELPFMIN